MSIVSLSQTSYQSARTSPQDEGFVSQALVGVASAQPGARRRAGQRLAAASKPSLPRLAIFDAARGLAVVGMIVATVFIASPAQNPLLARVSEFAATFAAPTFFLLAGMFLHRSMRAPWSDFLRFKIAPLVWRYALWAAVGILFALWLKAPLSLALLLRAFGRVLLDPPPMLLIVCVLALCLAAARLVRGLPVLLVLPVAALLEIAHLRYGGPIPAGFYRLFIYLYIGHVFAAQFRILGRYVAQNRAQGFNGVVVWALINAVAVVIILPFTGGLTIADLPFASLGLGLLGAASMIALASLNEGEAGAGLLRWIGQNALAIYLACFVPIEALCAIAQAPSLQTLLGVISCALGAVLLAMAMARRVAPQ